MTVGISTAAPEWVSTAVVASVLECHQEAQDLWFTEGTNLGSTAKEPRARIIFMSHAQAPTNEATTRHSMDSDEAVAEAEVHLRNLIFRSRAQRTRYLSDSGMQKRQISELVGLVDEWLNQDEILRLDTLSRNSADEVGRPSVLFAKWMNIRAIMRLVTLLDQSKLEDHHLAAAYAVCHAVRTASASYRPDTPAESKPLVLTPDDDLG